MDQNPQNNQLKISISEWDQQSRSIRKCIDRLENSLLDLRNRMLSLRQKSESSGEYSLTNIDDLTSSINSTSQVIVKKHKESKVSFPVLKEKASNTAESIGNIITHLQYHDIIRQKIEHVQRSHNTIIEELKSKSLEELMDNNGENAISDKQIADIVGLQAAQLILVSKEYQNAIEVITGNFQSIANDIKSISMLSSNFSYEEKQTETTLLKSIKDKLDEAIILLDQSDQLNVSIDMKEAGEEIGMLLERASKKVIEPLEKLGEEFQKSYENDEEDNSLNSQIEKMVSQVLDKNKNLEKRLGEIEAVSKELISGLEANELGTELEQERIQLMVRVSKMLTSLDIDNNMLDTVLSQNFKLNREILSKIETTINQVDYYMLFEEVLGEVIVNLNSINKTLKPDAGEDYQISDLKEIEKLYTVKSERIIHSSITGQDTGESQDDEDDLELF